MMDHENTITYTFYKSSLPVFITRDGNVTMMGLDMQGKELFPVGSWVRQNPDSGKVEIRFEEDFICKRT